MSYLSAIIMQPEYLYSYHNNTPVYQSYHNAVLRRSYPREELQGTPIKLSLKIINNPSKYEPPQENERVETITH